MLSASLSLGDGVRYNSYLGSSKRPVRRLWGSALLPQSSASAVRNLGQQLIAGVFDSEHQDPGKSHQRMGYVHLLRPSPDAAVDQYPRGCAWTDTYMAARMENAVRTLVAFQFWDLRALLGGAIAK